MVTLLTIMGQMIYLQTNDYVPRTINGNCNKSALQTHVHVFIHIFNLNWLVYLLLSLQILALHALQYNTFKYTRIKLDIYNVGEWAGMQEREHTRESTQERACKREHARESMQERACKREHARESMQERACKREHARESMQERACKREHARDQAGRCRHKEPAYGIFPYNNGLKLLIY